MSFRTSFSLGSSFATLTLAALIAACSSSEATPSPGTDAGTVTKDAGKVDAGPTKNCADPQTKPEDPCGTLAWSTSDVATRKRNHHVTLLAETKAGPMLYALGGFNGSKSLVTVDRTKLGGDGSLGEWSETTALPVAIGGHVGEVIGNVVVVAGGMGMTGHVDTSYSSVIQDDGSLGAWKQGGSIGQRRMHGGSFVLKDAMYILGGFDDPTVFDDVVRATIAADGTIGEWKKIGTLPVPRSHFGLTQVNGYVYLTGGLDKSALSNPPMLADVYRARLAEDGTLTEWTAMPKLPAGISTQASFFYGGYLYVAGGIHTEPSAAQDARVWRAAIQPDHGLGTWEAAAPLPVARGHVHHLPIFGTRVYSVSGAIDFNLNSTDQVHVGVFE